MSLEKETIDICYKSIDQVLDGLQAYTKAIADSKWIYERLDPNPDWQIGIANLEGTRLMLLVKLKELQRD